MAAAGRDDTPYRWIWWLFVRSETRSIVRPVSSALRTLPAAIAAGVLLATAQTAAAGELSVTLSPQYVEGLTGSNGWYTVAVTATYVCEPSGSEVVLICPPTEVFRDGTGAEVTGNDDDDDRASGEIVRTATFLRSRARTRSDAVTLRVGDGPLRVDTQPPPVPVIEAPSPGALAAPVLPGTALTAVYSCSFEGDASGPADDDACVGTVPSGARLDTGSGNRATWGTRALTVTATDAAGHTSQRTLEYRIAGSAPAVAPLAPTGSGNGTGNADRPPRTANARLMRPAAGATLRGTRVLRWRAARGAALYNVQVFRVAGDGYQKVLSAFPRANRLAVGTDRLADGERYVWRVWPYMRRLGDYRRTPVGISWFQTPAGR